MACALAADKTPTGAAGPHQPLMDSTRSAGDEAAPPGGPLRGGRHFTVRGAGPPPNQASLMAKWPEECFLAEELVRPRRGAVRCLWRVAAKPPMTAQVLIGLLEEMMDLKLQHFAETQLKLTPEVARLLQEKRETDRRRLDQIRAELIRILEG